jgi:hypothetical protein
MALQAADLKYGGTVNTVQYGSREPVPANGNKPADG